ncbi:MAG: DUF4918 family protein [Chlorobi bacterium]|nr:DUF4918 family protein [Chlorobiota bacterium]
MELSGKIISFLHHLALEKPVPTGIKVMNPYLQEEVKRVTRLFYNKFYQDKKKRMMILGINPGRFGAGITGISFTDPIRLEDICGIPNYFTKRQETSSVFIYEMIHLYGGCERFYNRYYVTAVCPLGFTYQGKNLNYYDRKDLENAVMDFIIRTIREQFDFGINREKAFCIGEGKNYTYLMRLNDKHHFFNKIIPLPHPRFVMQYRFREKNKYLNSYLELLK